MLPSWLSVVFCTITVCLVSTANGRSLHGVGNSEPWFCHGLDCPRFSVVDVKDAYEVREYEECGCSTVITMNSDASLMLLTHKIPLFQHLQLCGPQLALKPIPTSLQFPLVFAVCSRT